MSESNKETVQYPLNLIEEGKNSQNVVCQHCPSEILKKGLGEHKKTELPLPRLKAATDLHQGETISDILEVTDMYTFENIGFSKNVNNIKYLICADCEMGPIGWHNTDTKLNYIALSRVKNKI